MSNLVSEKCDTCLAEILRKFQSTGHLSHYSEIDFTKDYIFHSDRYRRAHVSVMDTRGTHKLWLLHVTVFPHISDPSPIYGFDIIAGSNKVSGAFHDFSPVRKNTPLSKWFRQQTMELSWNKPRELPIWAQAIFSDDIVAIGAVGIDELSKFCELGINNLEYYLDILGLDVTDKDYTDKQNFYCTQQRQNPHTPRVLQSLGFSESESMLFVENILFPLK